MQEKLSIVIPTMNRNDYLKQILNTIPNDLKVYVSDNGSFLSDEIINNYKNIKVIQSKKILEMYDNWNRAIMLAESEFILLPSDDDLYLEGVFDSVLHTINAYEHIDIFIFGHYYVDEYGEIRGEWKPSEFVEMKAPYGFENFKFGVDARWPSIVLRKSLIEKIGYFNADIPFAGDSELLQKALLYGNALFIPNIISKYRFWPNNATSLNQTTVEWRNSIDKWTSNIIPLVTEEYRKINKEFNANTYKDEIMAQNIISGGYLLYNNLKYVELDKYLKEIMCPEHALLDTKESYFKLCLRLLKEKSSSH